MANKKAKRNIPNNRGSAMARRAHMRRQGRTVNNQIKQNKQAKKKVKNIILIGRIFLSDGLDGWAWVKLFKENMALGILIVAVWLSLVIMILMILFSVLMFSVCSVIPKALTGLFALFNDTMKVCEYFK